MKINNKFVLLTVVDSYGDYIYYDWTIDDCNYYYNTESYLGDTENISITIYKQDELEDFFMAVKILQEKRVKNIYLLKDIMTNKLIVQ